MELTHGITTCLANLIKKPVTCPACDHRRTIYESRPLHLASMLEFCFDKEWMWAKLVDDHDNCWSYMETKERAVEIHQLNLYFFTVGVI